MKISPLTVLRAGIPNYILNLLRALAEVDNSNEYILYSSKPAPFDLGLPANFSEVTVSLPSPLRQFWYQVLLPLQMKKDRIDLFHDPVYPLPLPLSIPGVITVHDLSNYTDPGVHRLRAVLSGKLFPVYLRKARQIITDSYFTASELERLFPDTAHKVNVVHLGISDRFKRISSSTDLESAAKTYDLPPRFFLFLGTLEPRKNIGRLLEAFALSAPDIPHSLVISGGFGWKYDRLLELLADHPYRDRILLTGYVEEALLPALISSAEFLAYPSILEGFGFPILEAMACGTPVLTSNTSSMPEIAGEAAVLVDPLSVDSITRGINELACNSGLRKDLSKRGRDRADCFSWRETALRTLEVYGKAIK